LSTVIRYIVLAPSASGALRHAERIRLFFLPSYSPELNPDELLHHDVKANAVGRQCPTNQTQMIHNIRSYLRSTQRQPTVVQNFFYEKHVAYAAA
jgi:transposase